MRPAKNPSPGVETSALDNWQSTANLFAMTNRIELNPRVCGGRPVIKGTRIPGEVILGQLADGESWDALLKGYPELSRADIQATLRFAEASVVSSQITELVPA